MILTSNPFWWINFGIQNSLEAIRTYYESSHRETWTENRLKRGLSGTLSLFKQSLCGHPGEQEFYARLQLLLDAMNASPNANRDEAIRKLVQAAYLHSEADRTIEGMIRRHCDENKCWDERKQVAARIWEEHHCSPVRVKLLEVADLLQQEAKNLIQQ